jgi:hypothetical protein
VQLKDSGPVLTAEQLTIQERLKRVYYAPRSSFEAVLGREEWLDWFLPAVLVALMGLISHALSISVMDNLDSPVLRSQLQQMGEAQRQQFLNSMQMLIAQGWIMIPVGTFSSLVVVAFILQVMLRSLFEVDVTYRQALVIKGYASMVMGLEWIARAALVNMQQTPIVQTGMGWFVPASVAATFAGRVLTEINFFDIWQIFVIATGMSVVGGVSQRKAFIAVLVLWAIYVCGGAAIATATSSIMLQGSPQTG